MQEYLTKCPHCTTVFKLNQGHLDAAQGAVRCGSCLEVFNAKEHLLEQHAAEQLPQAANGDTLTTTAKKDSTLMPDPLAEDDDVHWTQALSNDIDKIYQYLATELDLDNDPELAQNLQNDQWGRDLLAELDEELSAPSAADDIAPSEPNTKPAKDIIAKSKATAAKAALKSTAKSRKSPPQGDARKTTSAPNTSTSTSTKSKEKSEKKSEISSEKRPTPKTQTTADTPKTSAKVKPAAQDDQIDNAQQISDAQSIQAMDDWSAALLDDLKQTVDLAEAAAAQSKKETAQKQDQHDSSAAPASSKPSKTKPAKNNSKVTSDSQPKSKPKNKTKPIEKAKRGDQRKSEKSAPKAKTTDEGTITPNFADPVGLEAEADAPIGEQAPLNENWSNSLLAELENQSKNIAENIKQALQDQRPNNLAPEKEVSLDDLALIPLREHSTGDDLSAVDATTNSTAKKTSKKTSDQTPSLASPSTNKSHAAGAKIPSQTPTPAPKKSAKSESDAMALADTPDQSADSAALDTSNGTADNTVTASLSTLAPEFESEMLPTPRSFPKIPWLAMCFILIFSASLAGQIAFFEFDYLAKDMRFRPYYAKVCEIAKCELPVQEDFAAIRSTQFVVRVHPTQSDALIVDANIRNQADFPQPFPAIELSFTDMNGKLVAQRRFAPDEYKRDKLKTLTLMPPNRKIHLTLEIVDPGKTAKNYELKLHKVPSNPT